MFVYIFVDRVLKKMYYMYTFRQMRSKPWIWKTLSHSVCKYSLWRCCSCSWQTKRQQKWNRLHYLVSRHRLLLLSSIPIRPSTLRTVKGWRETVFRIKEELLWVVVKSFLLSSHTSYRAGPFGPALAFGPVQGHAKPFISPHVCKLLHRCGNYFLMICPFLALFAGVFLVAKV